MSHVLKKLKEPAAFDGNNAFWFCHTRQAFDELPSELKESPRVVFVKPDRENAHHDENRQTVGMLYPVCNAPGFEFGAGETSTLVATQVFDEMIKQLELEPPQISRQPLHYYSRRLWEVLPRNSGFASRTYFIGRLSRTVRDAALIHEQRIRSDPCLASIDKIIELAQKAEYVDT